VVDDALSPDFPLGVKVEVFIRREDTTASSTRYETTNLSSQAGCGSRSASWRLVSRTDTLTRKVNESLVPKLEQMPGFKGFFLVDAGSGVFSTLGLFETPEQGKESTTIVATWIKEEQLDTGNRQSARGERGSDDSNLAATCGSRSASSGRHGELG
jgi:hypothetical protein